MWLQIIRMLTTLHASFTGARLRKMARSKDPEEARVGRNTLNLIYAVSGIVILICLFVICCPLALAVLIIAMLASVFRK